MEFQIGDVVRCIREDGFKLEVGKHYEVTGAELDDGHEFIRIDGDAEWFLAERFALVEGAGILAENIPVPVHQPVVEHPFAVGDLVACIDAGQGNGLVHGGMYTVREIKDQGVNAWNRFMVRVVPGGQWCKVERFRKWNPAQVQPVINQGMGNAWANPFAAVDNIAAQVNVQAAQLRVNQAVEIPMPAAKQDVIRIDGVDVSVGDYVVNAETEYRVDAIFLDTNEISISTVTVSKDALGLYQVTYNPMGQGFKYKTSIFSPHKKAAMKGKLYKSDRFEWFCWKAYDDKAEFQCANRLNNNDAFAIGDVMTFTREQIEGKMKLVENGIIKPKAKVAKPKVDVKKINNKVKEYLAQYRKNAQRINYDNNDGTADFKVFYVNEGKDEVQHYGSFGAPCHWNLKLIGGYGAALKDAKPVAVIDFINRLDGADASQLAMAEWIVKESPWKKVYKRIAWKNVFKNGLLLDITRSGREIASACIALRQCSEFPETCSAFPEFRKMGFSGEVSWLMASFIQENDGEYQFGHVDHGGHNVMAHDCPVEKVIEFLKNGLPDKPVDKPYSQHPTYANVWGIIGDTQYDYGGLKGIKAWIHKKIKTTQVGNGFYKRDVLDVESIKALGLELTERIHGKA